MEQWFEDLADRLLDPTKDPFEEMRRLDRDIFGDSNMSRVLDREMENMMRLAFPELFTPVQPIPQAPVPVETKPQSKPEECFSTFEHIMLNADRRDIVNITDPVEAGLATRGKLDNIIICALAAGILKWRSTPNLAIVRVNGKMGMIHKVPVVVLARVGLNRPHAAYTFTDTVLCTEKSEPRFVQPERKNGFVVESATICRVS
jgi:hypothetical protein